MRKTAARFGAVALLALGAGAFGAQPAQAAVSKCTSGGGFQLCIGYLVNSSGTLTAYTSTGCNLNEAGTSISARVTIRKNGTVIGTKTEKTTSGSSSADACVTATGTSTRNNSVDKCGALYVPSDSGFALLTVCDKLTG